MELLWARFRPGKGALLNLWKRQKWWEWMKQGSSLRVRQSCIPSLLCLFSSLLLYLEVLITAIDGFFVVNRTYIHGIPFRDQLSICWEGKAPVLLPPARPFLLGLCGSIADAGGCCFFLSVV